MTERLAAESDPRATVTLGVSLKLYLDVAQTAEWAQKVATIARRHSAIRGGAVRLFVMPSLPAIAAARDAFKGTSVRIGAQDLHWEDRGPYTGAVSGSDLKMVGCELVEVGHAERRLLFREDEEIVKRKLAAAVRNGLTPVLCIGENKEAEAVAATSECLAQLDSALAGLGATDAEIIVAYEPVWAIGRATPASTDHILTVVATLRDRIFGDPRLSASSVIYGGSAQRGSLTELGRGVDGLFLGRFAHNPKDLEHIIDEAAARITLAGKS